MYISGYKFTSRLIINSHVGPVTPVITFPRPIFLKDFDLNVGVFGALLGTAFEKLDEIIDVLSVAVGEGREVIGVPEHSSKLRAAAGEAQEVGGCYSLDMAQADVELRRRQALRCLLQNRT